MAAVEPPGLLRFDGLSCEGCLLALLLALLASFRLRYRCACRWWRKDVAGAVGARMDPEPGPSCAQQESCR